MKKGFILGIACATILTASFSYAADMLAEVYTSTFPIKLNGSIYTPEMPVLNYQGRTYLALREFGTVTNNEIDFQDNTIIINNQKEADDLNMVYVSKGGSKYHYDEHCNGATYHRTPLEDATSIMKLQPCEKCVLKTE